MITRVEEIDQIESEQMVDEGFDIPRDREILDKRAILFGAFVGTELVHVTQVFVGKEAHEIYPLSFAMPYGHTVGMAVFTAPEYRRKGIHLYTRTKVLRYLKESGVSRAWDVQEKDNEAARNSIMKLGYYMWGEGCRLRFLYLFTIEWTIPKSPTVSRKARFSMNVK
ncbi:GNAT family N-acetyltransferase [Chloroflexota bacterium]